jgi:transposase
VLSGRLIPDHKTIADFRKDSGPGIKQVCVQSIELCRVMGLLTQTSVAIDGSKFKAVKSATRTSRALRWSDAAPQLEKSDRGVRINRLAASAFGQAGH